MMKAGKYYIGKLDDAFEMNEISLINKKLGRCQQSWARYEKEGEFEVKRKPFAVYNNLDSGKSFLANNGKVVNAYGMIGCVALEHLIMTPNRLAYFLKNGIVHEFKEDFETSSKDGILKFGEITVDTRQEYTESPSPSM